jgi:hypothetical protein
MARTNRTIEMRRIHLIFGIVALAAFAFTGSVMRAHIPPLHELGDDVRLMYRSRHIYLFTSGIANVLLGVYFSPMQSAMKRSLQYAGSLLLLAAPVFLFAAFFAETKHGLAESTWRSHYGIYALFAGTLLHLLSAAASNQWT